MRTTGGLFFCLLAIMTIDASAADIVSIGTRRELFVDDFMIENMAGARLRLHQPEPREVVFVCDAPWEGNASGYFTLFPDGDGFRMYYRGWNFAKGEMRSPVICMAESKDGIRWTRPSLGVIEFNGSKDNNIVMDGPNEGASHNLTPFKDSRPDCPAEARYKAFGRLKTMSGSVLNAFQSPDGIHWTQFGDKPVLPQGAYDSQNLAFWEPQHGHYRAYWRPGGKTRSVRTGISRDFVHWDEPTDITYQDARDEHIYTPGIQPYPRSEGLYLGFPTRFYPYKPTGPDDRFKGSNQGETEPLFMSSRDGIAFHRWQEPVIPQSLPNRSGNRANYAELGLLILPGEPEQISLYASESGYSMPPLLARSAPKQLRRFTYRLDGFVSVNATGKGEMLTKPFRFEGRTLQINARTTEKGSILVALCNQAGKPLPGFAAKDCVPLTGDEIAWTVQWKGNPDLAAHAGQPLRLRFRLESADLFSIMFTP